MLTKFPILFILDQDVVFVFEEYKQSNYFILSGEAWGTLDKSRLGEFSAVVILSELAWGGNSLDEDHGFTIGLELRRKYKCLLPIIIISAMPQKFFELRAETDLKYNLIFARGTTFVPLITAQESLESILKRGSLISVPLLTDMNEMLFQLRGVLSDTLGHRLGDEMGSERYREVMTEMKALLNTQQIAEMQWDYFEDELFNALNNKQKFPALKREFLEMINRALPAAGLADGTEYREEPRHRLLLVEDDPDFAERVRQKLSGYFFEIIYTNNAEKAIQVLTNDRGNSIVGVLCDWRLYSDTSRKYWQMQGYEVLDFAAKSRYAALFGITSLSDANVHSIRNMIGFEMHLFKKEHFTGGAAEAQWKVMADVILQKCDDVSRLIASEPLGAAWQKLKGEYINHRNRDWVSFEHELSNEADKIFLFYKDAINSDKTRNVFSVGEMGLSLKNNLKNILIVRRVYFGLYFILTAQNHYLQSIRPASLLGEGGKTDTELKQHGIDAYSLIRKDWWDDIEAGKPSSNIMEEWEKYEQRQKNFRNTLGIDISLLPKRGLLPEEKAWMLRNGIDFSFLFNYWDNDL